MIDMQTSAAVLAVERLRLKFALLENEGAAEIRRDLATVEQELAGPAGKFRTRLINVAALSPAETDALDCAIACAVEPALGQAFASLQGGSTPWANEVGLRILFDHGPASIVHAGSSLQQLGLIEPTDGSPQASLRPDPSIVDWYFGRLTAGSAQMRKPEPVEPLPEWEVQQHADRLGALMSRGQPARLAIVGSDGSGRSSMAACIAQAMGKQAIYVDSATFAPGTNDRQFLRLQCMALLADLALIWRGAPPKWPANVPVSMLHFVALDSGLQCAPYPGVVDLEIEIPELSRETRDGLYQIYLPECAEQLSQQVAQPRLSDLADAQAQGIATIDAFRAFQRRRNIARTGNIGRIEEPRFRWDDLVLEQSTLDQLQDYAAEARLRADLFDDPERERVLGSNAHLTALFSGSPGLGKSMSAKVIAAELGLDLLVIDYANLSSKYIGETAKRLSATFRIAKEAQCALLFDEADTLFATRTKVETANDRHGNADIGHLLQLIETHRGVVMLSTNKRANIDPAMTRRLRFIIEFRKPKLAEREVLWDRMLGLFEIEDAIRTDLVAQVAQTHELTPAQIKGAALTAAYRAKAEDRAITRRDVENGIRNEITKEGRLVTSLSKPGKPAERIKHGS